MKRNFFRWVTLSKFGGQSNWESISLNQEYISGINAKSVSIGADNSCSRSDNLDFCSLIAFNSTIDENSFVITPRFKMEIVYYAS